MYRAKEVYLSRLLKRILFNVILYSQHLLHKSQRKAMSCDVWLF